MESNKIKKEVCNKIIKVLKQNSVDDKTIKQFEEVFWEETKGYTFFRKAFKEEKDLQKIERCSFRVNDECGHTASCKICGALGGN